MVTANVFVSPIRFCEINNNIKALALKDQDTIFRNIKHNYYPKYVEFIKSKHLAVSHYSFSDYLKDYIDIEKPFQVHHGVEFSSTQKAPRLSSNDWKNIADIIARIALSLMLEKNHDIIEPSDLAPQYDWDYVIIDQAY